MRTTLKRGIGRGAAVNGNGRAIYPPGVARPITVYRPEPRRRSVLAILGRILLLLLISALIIGAGLLGGVYLYFHEKVSDIQAHTPAMKIAVKRLDTPLPNAPATALVIGYDHRAGEEGKLPSLSDTIMLLRADPHAKTISMLSLPRDLLTEIYCPGRQLGIDRINAAYSECKQAGTLETVRQLTGLKINYLITVNFRGFKQIVDKLGGVWVDVDRRYFNDNGGRSYSTYATINLKPGYQRLNGSDALDYVRYRHTDSDLVRVARQQQFVRAVKEQVTRAISPANVAFRLPQLVDAITHNVEIGRGGSSTVSGKTILSYALFAYQLPPGHLFQARLDNLQPAGPFGAELQGSPGDIEAAVREFTSPDVSAPEKATAVALGRRLRPKGPRPQDISLTVLNGNGIAGSATDASYELGKRGYRVLVSQNSADRNAPTFDYTSTEIYFDRAQRRAHAAAVKVASLFRDAEIAPLPPSIRGRSNGAKVTVVLGKTFDSTLAPEPVDQTPKKQSAAVVVAPDATIGLLRAVKHRVAFRLEYPRLLEHSSSPDREFPIRVYAPIRGKRAVRLVFKTSSDANEFWGIEETDWEEAPILQRPSQSITLKGRRFDLYYSGPHLHMVVLREHGATYWVVNTLLDSLSNETMLAIARGLRPLGT
jgi:LCP family protein required for cell wall assembly